MHVLVADVETRLDQLREQLTDLSNRLIRMEERVLALCKDMEKQEARGQRVPVLLLAAISAMTGAVSVLFQLWISKGP